MRELRRVRKSPIYAHSIAAQRQPENGCKWAYHRLHFRAYVKLAEMPLNELRQARGLSQKMLAEVLHVQQPSIAKIEKRTDMYISTLRRHIEAMGSELEVVARLPGFCISTVPWCLLSPILRIFIGSFGSDPLFLGLRSG